MRKLTLVERHGSMQYLLDGNPVPANSRIREDARAPHPMFVIGGEPAYGIEWWVDGQLRGVVPERNPDADAVYAAFESGDWSRIPPPDERSPMSSYEFAADAVRDSVGYQAQIRWVHIERVRQLSSLNHGDLIELLDHLENRAAFDLAAGLELNDAMRLDQRLFNVAASYDSLRDQLVKGDVLKAYTGSAFRDEVRSEVDRLWAVPEMAFLQGLRNTLVHMYQVGHGLYIEVGGEAEHARVVIHPRRLLEYGPNTFPQPGKDFAVRHERLNLREYVEAVQLQVTSFSGWLAARVLEHHAADLQVLAKLKSEERVAWERLCAVSAREIVEPIGKFTIATDAPDAPTPPRRSSGGVGA